jgi:hypothetical protein
MPLTQSSVWYQPTSRACITKMEVEQINVQSDFLTQASQTRAITREGRREGGSGAADEVVLRSSY